MTLKLLRSTMAFSIFAGLSFATSAASFTINPADSNDTSFGEVAIGSTVARTFNYTAVPAIPTYEFANWVGPVNAPSTTWSISDSTCVSSNTVNTCSFTLSFTPTTIADLDFGLPILSRWKLVGLTDTLLSRTDQSFTGSGIQAPPPAVPLPAGLPLVLTGLAGFAGFRMRKKQKAQ
ncbi:VPLPA-CTERM sorting domain-containing protein [Tateyamaria sp.]|uniref:VPLPA-CTERM sorting domain-containing protein n=1 Tax=Tateyamaria sp. TaxID=1929288 RepID=UPI00329E971B